MLHLGTYLPLDQLGESISSEAEEASEVHAGRDDLREDRRVAQHL